MGKVQEGGFAEEFIGLVKVHNDLVAVVREAGDFDLAFDDKVDGVGGLVLIVNNVALFVLHDGGAGEVS